MLRVEVYKKDVPVDYSNKKLVEVKVATFFIPEDASEEWCKTQGASALRSAVIIAQVIDEKGGPK